jgi:hypothetical protein
MSRINEAWNRLTGAASEPHAPSVLERFGLEKAPRPDDGKVSNFVAAGPRTVEGNPRSIEGGPSGLPPAPASVRDQAAPHVESQPNVEDESNVSSELFDFRQIIDYAGFLTRSLRRHSGLTVGTFSLALAVTTAAAILLPRTYHVQTKLLAQRNAVMAALSNPGRAVPSDADAPTRAAAETVLRRDNLLTMIGQTHLLEEWTRTRAPILRVKDWLMVLFRRRPTEAERLDRLVGLLEARMVVVTGPAGDGTVTIDLDWPDGGMAYRLVESAQQLFVEARQAAETAAIAESIGILERYAATLHESISRTLNELQSTQVHRGPPGGTPRVAARSSLLVPVVPSIAATLPPVPAAALGAPALGANLDDPQIPRLKAAIAAKRQEMRNLEEVRQRQLAELEARLVQLTTVYTATHPAVASAQQNIAAISRDSPQMVTLKAETERLETEYQKRTAAAEELLQVEQLRAEVAKEAPVVSAPQPAPHRRAVQTLPTPTEQPGAAGEATDLASVSLRLELNQLESVLERTDGARIELAVSKAAFKYRYTVIRPAQVPKAPISPNLQAVFGAGLFCSLVLALVAAVGKDLLSGRILERWQVERQLGLPVLGTVGTV